MIFDIGKIVHDLSFNEGQKEDIKFMAILSLKHVQSITFVNSYLANYHSLQDLV